MISLQQDGWTVKASAHDATSDRTDANFILCDMLASALGTRL